MPGSPYRSQAAYWTRPGRGSGSGSGSVLGSGGAGKGSGCVRDSGPASHTGTSAVASAHSVET